MKKFLMLVLMIVLLAATGAAAEVPDGYPALVIDPATGLPYDLGGRAVTIYDFWSSSSGRVDSPTAEQQARYDYEDWLMETYNCTVSQRQGGNWGTCAQVMMDFVNSPDGSLRVYIIEPGKVGSLVTNGYAADWNRSVSVDTSDPQWNKAVVEGMSAAGGTYGVTTGNSEPRQCLYFNKCLLEEAGINWNTIYDMQANDTWTWDAFETLLKKVHRDTDNDGVIDVYGLTGSESDFYYMGVFSNGGSFFQYDENGKLEVSMTSESAKQGLKWTQGVWARYARPYLDGDNWDYYKSAWYNGEAAFYIYQAYGGFNDNSEMAGMLDPWGCVAFPMGPKGDQYLTVVSENTALIPNVYDDREIAMISMIYDLWKRPTPNVSSDDAWIGNKYEYTDDRAVDETYGMLRDPENAVVDLTYLLGPVNDVLGVNLLWGMQGATVEELLEAGLPAWQAMCDELNARRVLTVDLTGFDTMELPSDLITVEAGAFTGTDAEVIVLPSGCRTIGANAFANCPRLLYVVIPSSVNSISADAFSGCSSLQRALVYRKSYASQYCWENDLTCMYLAAQQLSASPRVWTIDLD